ncbi:restriction endonuclease [Mycolicibacterium arabiense]|uniref:restriction endonuclease n=1 Tax=Mycolicibacterium arabiense TaxID=1286181 RepID=UPI0013D63EE7|nr:restriction endonuclease [Mycolicibacterium arabiense]
MLRWIACRESSSRSTSRRGCARTVGRFQRPRRQEITGVDLVARKAGESIAVQCKRYGKPVRVSALQQVVSGSMHHQCTASMVVCNQDFTKAAMQLARTHNCRLIGRCSQC